jgi:hypothetical protein
MFKDKIERLESRGEESDFVDPGHCGVEVNGRVDLEAKQAIREGRNSQLLLPVADPRAWWKKKGREMTGC